MISRPGKLTKYFTRSAIDKCLHAIQTAIDDFPLPYTEDDKKVHEECVNLLKEYRNRLREDRDGLNADLDLAKVSSG